MLKSPSSLTAHEAVSAVNEKGLLSIQQLSSVSSCSLLHHQQGGSEAWGRFWVGMGGVGRGKSGCAVSHQHCQSAEGHSKGVALCLAPSTPPLPPAQSMPNQ